jgi:hypothetical protein
MPSVRYYIQNIKMRRKRWQEIKKVRQWDEKDTEDFHP